MEISLRGQNVKESSTLAITAKAKEMKASGIDIVSFSAGEPDFATPAHVCKAAMDAMNEGFTKYTATNGILELRVAICEKLKVDNNLQYKPNEIVVTNGAKQAIYNALAATINERDEVIVFAPYWISYAEMIGLCGGVMKVVETTTENGLKPTIAQLESALTSKTKAIIINSPCNPTGVVYNEKDLEMIAQFAVSNDLYVISDEIYETLIFDENEKHISIASLNSEIFDRTIVINGYSKSHAMTGWRVGYSASSAKLANVMGNILGHTTSNINSITQKAALVAQTGDQQCLKEMKAAFAKRRDLIYDKVCQIPKISVVKPAGAFYVFIDITGLCGVQVGDILIRDSADLAQALLTEYHVAVVPGGDFGAPMFMRLSYATSEAQIVEGMARIEAFVKKYYKY